MDDVEHHETFGNLGFVFDEFAAGCVAAPDFESDLFVHFISSMTCFKSSRIAGIGSRRNFMEPSAALEMTELYFCAPGSLFGKSSRKWPPRLSLRSMAARAMASETVSKCFKSIAVCQPGLYSRWP